MTTREQLNNRASIITGNTEVDHFVAYEGGLFTLVRGDKQAIGDSSAQIMDNRLYTALSKNELMEAMRLYEEGFRLGQLRGSQLQRLAFE